MFGTTNFATGRSSIPATIGTSGRVGPTKRPTRMVNMLCWCSACSVLSSNALFFFMNDQRCNGFLKRQPSQKEIQSPSRQPIIPASHACQKLTSPLPISAPSPAIITVPGRINPTSASDSRNATSATAMSEYITDWVIKCSSNACITIPVRKRISDSA